MANISSDNLFNLIKSLTRQEKRYFRRFASALSSGQKRNYIRVFDILDKQQNNDEEAIIRKIKPDKNNQFPVLKNYLYNLLLDALHGCHLNLSLESELNKRMHLVAVLYYKGLFPQCNKLLVKIRETAAGLDKHEYIYQALLWEKRIMLAGSYAGVTEKELSRKLHLQQLALEKLSNASAYDNIQARLLFFVNHSGEVRNKEQQKRYGSIIGNPLLQSSGRALCHTSGRIFYNIHLLYNFYAKGDLKKTYLYAQKYLALTESSPGQIAEDPDSYIAVLNNFLVICIQLYQYDKAAGTLKKMRQMSRHPGIRQNPWILVKIFFRSYILESDMYIRSGAFGKVADIMTDVENGLKALTGREDKASRKILCYNMAHLCFGTENYSQAVSWLNRILQEPDQDTKEDILCVAKILQLIAHYELGDTDLLPYLFSSSYRFFIKRNRIYRFEAVMLEYLRKLSRADNINKMHDLYVEIKSKLLLIADDPFEKKMFRYFDFLGWVESKIENRSFSEVLKEKAEKFKNNL